MGGTRVLLELVIGAFLSGETPEQIVQDYESIRLADAYAVIAYYLRHRDQVDGYMAEREAKAQEVRAKLDAAGLSRDMADIRRRLAARTA